MNKLLAFVVTLCVLAVSASAAPKAAVRVAHACPDAPAVDILVNGSRAVSSLEFTNITDYLMIDAPASYNFTVVVAGTNQNVFSAVAAVDARTPYTVAAINTLSNIAPDVLEDSTKIPESDEALVRFVHFSPDAPAVDILADNNPIFTNVSYKTATAYLSVAEGTYDVAVRVSGTNTTVLTVNDVELKNRRIYSVFAEGLVAQKTLTAVLAEDY